MAIEVRGFSPEALQAIRGFFEAHPVYRMEQHREIDTTSSLVRVVEGKCGRCGLVMKPQVDVFPSDTLRAMTVWHDWNLDRNAQCGGQVEFVVEPVV